MNYNNLLPIDKFYVASTNEAWWYEQPQITPIATHHVSLTKKSHVTTCPNYEPKECDKKHCPFEGSTY